MTEVFGKKLSALLDKYKYMLLVILIGILLLMLPVFSPGESKQSVAETDHGTQDTFDLEAMEQKLEDALSQINGAGKVTVVLTVKTGARQILAENAENSMKDGDTEQSKSTVILSKGSGYQDVVSVQEIYPQYQGALVVCAGGGDPAVKLKLVEAVSALTGLSSNKISICKGK